MISHRGVMALGAVPMLARNGVSPFAIGRSAQPLFRQGRASLSVNDKIVVSGLDSRTRLESWRDDLWRIALGRVPERQHGCCQWCAGNVW